ncbi:MAG: alpha/beta hydrolase [Lachnospiraceae bacterium]|nr:alpha/beta hydrolase [Lachnospiraceae bacterium]
MPTFINNDHQSIYYEEYGSGDRYLLCTQVGHGENSFEKEMARRGFHVYLLTNRGFGRSEHITEDYPNHWYDKFAEDVICFADQMGIERFCYSGASHGAGTGWHVVLNYPGRVECFFAVVPGPHSLAEGSMSYKKMLELGLVQPKPMQMPTSDPALLLRREKEHEANEKRRAEPDYEKVYNDPVSQNIQYGRPLAALGSEEALIAALKTIETPVLILGGTEDFISRPDLMVRSAENLKNCKLVIYSGFGHGLDIYEEMADEAEHFYRNWTGNGTVYTKVEP